MRLQIESIGTSSVDSKGVLELKVEGTSEHLRITTPSLNIAEYIGMSVQLIDQQCH